MDPMGEEQLDYGDEGYGGSQKYHLRGSGRAIPALAEEELMGEDDEYDDLYSDVNVGDGLMRTLQPRPGPPAPSGNSGLPGRSVGPGVGVADLKTLKGEILPGVGIEGRDPRGNTGFPRAEQLNSGSLASKALEQSIGYPSHGVSQSNRAREMVQGAQVGNLGFQGAPAMHAPSKVGGGSPFSSGPSPLPPVTGNTGFTGGPSVLPHQMGIVGNRPVTNGMGHADINGPTTLFVGELHWWTSDAELESVMSQYGRVKEIKFFEERASGKSKGYCQVEFYDPAAAAACKEGMNGYMFNGRACVVTFASSQTLKQMGSGYMKRNQIQVQAQPQGRGMINDGNGSGGSMNYQGGDGGRSYGKAGWGRGGQGMLNRGQGNGGSMRGRGLFGPKVMAGEGGGIGAAMVGGPFGQGLVGAGFGGPAGAMMHPQNMMAGFDPTYMGRGGAYGGFAAPAFPGMMPSFPGMNAVGLTGVAPHVNPAFFGRGMMANGMGMMGSSGMDGNSGGMWAEAGMGWAGEEPGKTKESSYGGNEPNYGYEDETQERGGKSNASRERDRGSERDWPGNSERTCRDERENGRDRPNGDCYREGKDAYRDHRQRDRGYGNEDDRDRGLSSSRSRGRSGMMQEEGQRSRSRDRDYGKRRRD